MKRQLDNIAAAMSLFQGAANNQRFSDELNRLINQGQISLESFDFNVKVDISGQGGRFAIIDENTTKTNGVSTISGNKLPKNRGALVNMVGVFHGVGDTTKKGGVKYETALPAALQNAIFGIRQQGNIIIERSVSDLQAAGTPQEPKEQVLEFQIPFFLRDDDAIEMYFQFPDSVSMEDAASAGSELLANIKMWGLSTRRKA